jgi:hypothetical protein
MFSAEMESGGKTNSPKNVPDPGLALRFRQSQSRLDQLPDFYVFMLR